MPGNPRVAPDLVRDHAPKVAELTDDELAEVITHLAFYAGWPAAMSATTVLASITDASAGEPVAVGDQTSTE